MLAPVLVYNRLIGISRGTSMSDIKGKPNKLINEKSPYLCSTCIIQELVSLRRRSLLKSTM
jgi:hypothetical protein